MEVPIDQVQEELHHHAAHAQESWITKVALSSAFLAVFAALSALLAGHESNEAMIQQIKASDQWGYYQAKGIKSALISSRVEILSVLGKTALETDKEKISKYKEEQDKISEEAKKLESESKGHLLIHQILARAVTLIQVAIAIGAVSALTRRKLFWYVSLSFGLVGIGFLIQGLIP